MSIIASEEQCNRSFISVLSASISQYSVPANQDLISLLSEHNVQPSETALVDPPPHFDEATDSRVTSNATNQATITTLIRAFTVTNVK